AVGAPIVVKPAPATPLSALVLGEILAETDLPAGAFSVLPMPNELAQPLITDERLPVISFTGGQFGRELRGMAPTTRCPLGLGGNAAAVVLADAVLDGAARRIALCGNAQAGQVGIGVQRVVVEGSVYEEFAAKLVERVEELVTGDPADEATQVGPLIDEAAAARVEQWVNEAVERGATLLTGGIRDGGTVALTVLA